MGFVCVRKEKTGGDSDDWFSWRNQQTGLNWIILQGSKNSFGHVFYFSITFDAVCRLRLNNTQLVLESMSKSKGNDHLGYQFEKGAWNTVLSSNIFRFLGHICRIQISVFWLIVNLCVGFFYGVWALSWPSACDAISSLPLAMLFDHFYNYISFDEWIYRGD